MLSMFVGFSLVRVEEVKRLIVGSIVMYLYKQLTSVLKMSSLRM